MKRSFTPFLQALATRLSFFLVLLLTSISYSGLAQLPTVASGYNLRVHATGGLLAGQQLYGIVGDPVSGNVYVAASNVDYGTQCCYYINSFNLYKITPAGTVSLVGNYNFQFFEIAKLTWGPDGLIYTRDMATSSIKTINPATGASATYATHSLYSQARYALNFDPAGNLIYGFEAMFDFYKVTPTAPIHLGRVTASLPNGNHGDAFGIQPNGNYVVYVDCGGRNNYAINTAGHVAGTGFSSLAWTGTSNLLTDAFYGAAACAYSNGAIDPLNGDVYSIVSNAGAGNTNIVFTAASGGASSLLVSNAGNGIRTQGQSKGINDLTFGKATNGCTNSLFFTDRYTNRVYELTKTCNQPPAVSCPSNITVNADQGVCGATVTYPAATATGVPAPTITYSHPSGSFFPVGTTTVTVTASNTSGPDATCTFTVTVNGGLDTDSDGTTDVCDTDDDGDGTPDPQDCAPLNAAIHPGATETCNGVDDDCDGTVDDGFINTVVTCPVSGVVTRNVETCLYTVEGAEFNATVTENCGPLGYTLTGATTGTGTSLAGVELNAGETSVTWSATNAAGQAVSSSFTVKVVPPVPNLTCPENVTVAAPAGQCGAVVNYTAPSAPPACNSIPVTTKTFEYTGQVVSWIVPAGVTSITVQAYGAAGGTSTGEVVGQTFLGGLGAGIKGTLAVTPGETIKILVGQRGTNGTCGSGGGGGTFIVRNTGNELLLAAGGGGGGFHCNVLLGRNGGPGLAGQNGGAGLVDGMPANYLAGRPARPGGTNGQGGSSYYGGGGGGWLTAGVSNGDAVAGGGAYPGNGGLNGGGFGGGGGFYRWGCCGGSGGGGGYSGGSGGASDGAAGGGGGSYNSGTDQQNVTGVRSGNGLVTITYGTASYTVTQTAGFASGATFPVGKTTNSFEINDGNGNISTCSFTVTVKDEEAPTVSCPENIAVDAAAGECAAAVDFVATPADNCSATVTYYLHYGDAELRTAIDDSYAFPIGVHTVTAVAKDASGNEATCTFTVTVNDVTPPTFTCPQGQEAAMDNNCQITVPNLISALQGADQCGQVSFTQAPLAGTLLNAAHNGTYGVTITARDESGNETSCTVTLTAKDVTAPTFTCPENRTVNLDASCAITVPDLVTGLTGSDYCGQVTFTQSPLAATVINATHGSTHTVTITAADGNGNTTTCTVTLTAADVTPPVLQEPAGITQNTDAGQCGASVSITSPGATDNCAGVQVAGVRNDAQALTAQYPVGTTIITWTATDAAGLTDTYEQAITISDKENPLITCPQPVAVVNDAGVCQTGNVVIGVATATDACGIRSIVGVRSDNLALGAAYPVGTTTITWTATDNNGNTASCTQTITVTDNEVPHVITKNITR